VRRYEAPDENAFFPDKLEEPILPALGLPKVLTSYQKEINVNDEIKHFYINRVIPLVAPENVEQPENMGSCALTDIECLQSISRRIHFGKFVAESKFRSEKEKFTELIKAKDIKGIEDAITNQAVEQQILDRLIIKAQTYGIDPTLRWSQKAQGQIKPEAVVEIYKECIIPLTKKVEVDYLLRRLEEE
jgi:chorismate mutase